MTLADASNDALTGLLLLGGPLMLPDPGQVPDGVTGYASALGARLATIRCTECDRPLTDPESRARKIGPDCWDTLNATPASTLGLRADYGHCPEQLELGDAA